MKAGLRSLLVLLPALLLVACETTKPPLPGERLSVLRLDKQLEPDPEIAALEVRLPRPVVNNDWPEAGGYPNHVMQHVALGDDIQTSWRSSIGDGSSRYGRILAPPVAFGDRVYAMDADSTVSAFERKTGKQVWSTSAKPEDAGPAFGGGVAYAEDRIFVTTGYGQIVAFDANTGKEIWRQGVVAPLRSAPTVSDGRVFAITVDNQLQVLATSDGRTLWTHSGTPETAGLLGGASPAVEGDVVVAAYSSGELFALRVENGRQLWTDNLAAARRTDALSALADIRGRPVIDRGRVYAVSHSGRMVAIDLRTGERIWEQDIGGTESPWVAGDFIFVISNDSELICLTRRDGRVRWVEELPRYEDLKKKKGSMTWSGPILGGDRLIVVASNGEAMSFSPYTGAALGRVELPDGTFLTPIIANETLYVLTDEADLIAMR
ncbi:MAG TPA: PQQ-binding-like beta-propeller repeat protein [Stellaceae bacterium]|jgi:outer membrane protein assembly factor BamB|nr:PQQ-binding-like beta-propeller repeat protein [Stellaceae bacterium]